MGNGCGTCVEGDRDRRIVRLSDAAIEAADRMGGRSGEGRERTIVRALATRSFFMDLEHAGAVVLVKLPGEPRLKEVVFRR